MRANYIHSSTWTCNFCGFVTDFADKAVAHLKHEHDPATEHERLRSAVVDAVRGWRWPAADDRWYESRLRDAIDALIEFESRHEVNP